MLPFLLKLGGRLGRVTILRALQRLLTNTVIVHDRSCSATASFHLLRGLLGGFGLALLLVIHLGASAGVFGRGGR